MATYHLNFWSKNTGGAVIERVYVNTDDRSSLGYFEMRIGMEPRGGSTYYDQHRIAKGDTVAETGRTYSTTLPAEAAATIYSAPSIAAHIEASKMNDDFSKFNALRAHARGTTIIGFSRAQEKSAKERVKKFAIDL